MKIGLFDVASENWAFDVTNENWVILFFIFNGYKTFVEGEIDAFE